VWNGVEDRVQKSTGVAEMEGENLRQKRKRRGARDGCEMETRDEEGRREWMS
jgi:hypothetical protein